MGTSVQLAQPATCSGWTPLLSPQLSQPTPAPTPYPTPSEPPSPPGPEMYDDATPRDYSLSHPPDFYWYDPITRARLAYAATDVRVNYNLDLIRTTGHTFRSMLEDTVARRTLLVRLQARRATVLHHARALLTTPLPTGTLNGFKRAVRRWKAPPSPPELAKDLVRREAELLLTVRGAKLRGAKVDAALQRGYARAMAIPECVVRRMVGHPFVFGGCVLVAADGRVRTCAPQDQDAQMFVSGAKAGMMAERVKWVRVSRTVVPDGGVWEWDPCACGPDGTSREGITFDKLCGRC